MIENNTVPSGARILMEQISECDAERLTVIEKGRFTAAQFAGIVACRDKLDTETNAGWLRLKNTFGQIEFMPKPTGRFAVDQIMPVAQRERDVFAMPKGRVRTVKSIEVSPGQAAWLFLDGELGKTEIEASEDTVEQWTTQSFHHGTGHWEEHSKRLGWKVPIDLNIHVAWLVLNRARLNILLERRNDQQPEIRLAA